MMVQRIQVQETIAPNAVLEPTLRSTRSNIEIRWFSVRSSPIGLKYILEALDKSKKLPGPATYKQPDFIGPIKPTIVPSRIYTPQCSSIPRADTRFKLPSKKLIKSQNIFCRVGIVLTRSS